MYLTAPLGTGRVDMISTCTCLSGVFLSSSVDLGLTWLAILFRVSAIMLHPSLLRWNPSPVRIVSVASLRLLAVSTILPSSFFMV